MSGLKPTGKGRKFGEAGGKDRFRDFPQISGFFLGGNVLFTLLRLQSPIIRIHGSQRDISSVADHERSDGDEILLSST